MGGKLGVRNEKRVSPLRVVIAAHSHPEVTKGGAEIAAYQLFSSLSNRKDCEAWFIGCDREGAMGRDGSIFVQPFSDREYLYSSNEFDWFKFANRDPRFPAEFENLIVRLAPDVIHFHHYINFGVESFLYARRTLPNCRIIVTLHEYLAICHHMGQMVTKPYRNLCPQSGMSRCVKCYPEFARSDFLLREKYIKRFMNEVDQFICPSSFLARRYIAWGLPENKLKVLENLVPTREPETAEPRYWAAKPLRVGFFGQISVLKGINVLLDAAAILERKRAVGDVVIEIYGDYRNQPEDF